MRKHTLMLSLAAMAATLWISSGTADAQVAGGRGQGQGQAQGQGGQGGGRFGGQVTSPYENQLEQMTQAVQLSEEQKGKVKEKIDAMNKDVDTLLTESRQKMRQNMQGQRGQGGGRTPADFQQRRQQMQEQFAQVQEDMQNLVNDRQVHINEELTSEQRLAWETDEMNRLIAQRAQTLNLTEDQKTQLKSAVEEAAQAAANAKDGKEITAAQGKLVKKIVTEILTEQQASRLMAPGGGGMGMGGLALGGGGMGRFGGGGGANAGGGFGRGQGGQGGGQQQGGGGGQGGGFRRGGGGGAGGRGGQAPNPQQL